MRIIDIDPVIKNLKNLMNSSNDCVVNIPYLISHLKFQKVINMDNEEYETRSVNSKEYNEQTR